MATKKIKAGYHFDIQLECDYCGKKFNSQQSIFKDAMHLARRYGWEIKKVDDKWHHYCGIECLGKAKI